MKKVYLVCNAHIDPVWQWEWEEGAAETLSTFRTAARFCEEYDGFVFNHNEALLYRWIEEYEPALFERIRSLVKAGKWHIMGGWHLQPDCNMPSGEAFVRQILEGRKYFLEKFGCVPTTAINFDPFGHSRGLVQIMSKCGYDSYLFMRPGSVPLPAELFRWEGFDGSSVMGYRMPTYGSHLGKATVTISRAIEKCPEDGAVVCLWGIGDHGGGPSKIDLDMIAEMTEELKKQGVELIHSAPEDFFRTVDPQTLPKWDTDLNSWAPGCYTSMARMKRKYRQTENTLFTTERMLASAEAAAGMTYPRKEVDEALYDLLTVQFHDMLPGSSVQPGEEMALRMLDHGLENLSRVKGHAFFALAGGQKPARPDAIPVMVYNPHPFEVEGDFTAEMMLWDQNWAEEFSLPAVMDEDGRDLPTQCEKENSSLNLDWRKRAVFHARLKPMQMNRFDCRYDKVPARPVPTAEEENDCLILSNDRVKATISKNTGALVSVVRDGKEYLSAPCRLAVMNDDCDPWGMNVTEFTEEIGAFSLLSPEEGQKLCGIKAPIPSVHCVASGPVRTTAEVFLGYENSRAIVRYTLSQFSDELTVEFRLMWMQTQRMVKFVVPTSLKESRCFGQTAYGEQEFAAPARENCAQKYVLLRSASSAVAAVNDGSYASHYKDDTLYLTLLRSPAYCAHPILDRDIIVQDRYTPHMDLGERQMRFALFFGKEEEITRSLPRAAAVFNENPMTLAFYPPVTGEKPKSLLSVSGDPVEIPAVKKAEDGDGYAVRVFNPWNRPAKATLTSDVFGVTGEVGLTPFEIKTLRLNAQGFAVTDLLEGLISDLKKM